MNEEVLNPAQRAVMERVIAEEEQKRYHVVIALSGAHAYGFPSSDSDLDLKSVHIEPTARVLGLDTTAPHADRMEVVDQIEIDYT
jgi:predicted nucleotidyltransferase